jgi:TPP-dependent indolepyruvate ferredoxin oxidoreductase alpha subunit
MYGTVLLEEEVDKLRGANAKTRQKHKRSTRQIARESGLTGAEAAEALLPPTQAIEHVQHALAVVGEQAIQQPQTTGRAPPRCSGCRELGIRSMYAKIASFKLIHGVLVVKMHLKNIVCGMVGGVSGRYVIQCN